MQYELTDKFAARAASRVWLLQQRMLILVVALLILISASLSIAFYTGAIFTCPRVASVLLAGSLLISFFHSRARIRRLLRKMDNRGITLDFSPVGVGVRSEFVESHVRWEAFDGLVDYPDMWLLFLRAGGVITVPTGPVTAAQREFILYYVSAFGRGRPRCRSCGYDLRGLREPRCPECGTEFNALLLERSE